MDQENIHSFFKRLEHNNPHPRIELEYTNNFTLLVAVLLSAQTTDHRVNLVTRKLFQVIDNPEALLRFGEKRLCDAIRTIGLFKTKAHNLLQLSHILIDHYQGQVPDNREALESLPGVGHKTASVVLNVAFGHNTIAVDRHIFRVVHRINLASGKSTLAVEQALEDCIPEQWKYRAHHWLVLHGRYICKARRPLCSQCLVSDLCAYPNKVVSRE